MASSKHKNNVNNSISHGSDEDFDHSCVPCYSDGQHVEARAFCVECEEYLCNTCLQCHRKTKASRHHQMLIGKNMNKHSVKAKPAKGVFEKCSVHIDEVIKFFCTQHNVLGCSDCITLNHRTCNLDYLPDKFANIGQEYTDTVKNLEEELNSAKEVMKKAEERDRNIDESYRAVMNKIIIFREKIDNHLDAIQKKTEASASKMRTKNKQKVQEVLTSCAELTTSMEKLKTSLIENKTGHRNGELFVNMKKAKSTLQSEEKQAAATILQHTNSQFSMECFDDDYSKVFSAQTFGKLTELLTLQAPHIVTDPELNSAQSFDELTEQTTDEETSVSKTNPELNSEQSSNVSTDLFPLRLQYQESLYVKTGSDRMVCNIVACDLVTPEKLLMADFNNGKVKLLDLAKNVITDQILVGGNPYDVAVLPGERIAVTVDSDVMFLDASGKLMVYSVKHLQSECRGIYFKGNSIFIVSVHPSKVIILDLNGFYKRTVSLGFDDVNCLATRPGHKFLYFSNFSNYQIVRRTKQGHESTFDNQDIDGPLGMVVLNDGSLLVCCRNNKTIQQIDSNFDYSCMINNRVHDPQAIGYNEATGKIYVCQSQSNKLKIFSTS